VGDNNKQQKPAHPLHLLRELFHGKKKWVTGLVILILVVGVGVGAWLFISAQRKSTLQSSESQSSETEKTLPTDETVQVAKNAQKLANSGQVDEANAA